MSQVEEFYNRCHGPGGRFCSSGGGRSSGGSGSTGGRRPSTTVRSELHRKGTDNGAAKTPRQSYDRSRLGKDAQETYDEARSGGMSHGKALGAAKAVAKLAAGKTVKIAEPPKGFAQATTILKAVALDMKRRKDRGLPDREYNLCKVTVPGTNMFCGKALDIPRSEMPQLAGKPRPGSKADKLPKDKGGEVNVEDAFADHLKAKGIKVTDTEVPASSLKASQKELKGTKVNGMVNNKDFEPSDRAIYVSRDGYVIDGHHRWAAQVYRDIADGRSGELPLKVRVVDLDIKDALKATNAFADEIGIMPKTAAVNG
jgi:hypothetical protein